MYTEEIVSETSYEDIPGWPGYRVGNDGSVWRLWITCRAGRKLSNKWRQMKTGIHRKGYLYVNLTPPEGGSYKTFRIHRLVLEAFVGPCPDGLECRHLNGIKSDCRLTNLKWGTPEENRKDNYRLNAYRIGENNQVAKLTNENVQDIRNRYTRGNVFMKELADEYGVSISNIHAIVHRRSWQHLD